MNNNFTRGLDPSIKRAKISLESIDDSAEKIKATWNTIPSATKYMVYVSPTPYYKNKVAEVTSAEYIFTSPLIVPEDVLFHFWVSYIDSNSNEIFIDLEPTTLFDKEFFTDYRSKDLVDDYICDDEDIRSRFEEIRRRHKAVIETDGEDFYLYLRKWSGQPCNCVDQSTKLIIDNSDPGLVEKKQEIIDTVQNSDPDYSGRGRHLDCFGTGIYGGYYPKIKIRIRYGSLPVRTAHWTKSGIDFSHDFDSWTLWSPKLHEHDVLIRLIDGDRFSIQNVGETSVRGGIILHQEMKTLCLPRTDIIYQITDDRIWAAINKANLPEFQKAGWNAWM